MASSSQYWRDRELAWQAEYARRTAYWDSKIWEIYDTLQKDMMTEIDAWYSRFATATGMTMQQARQAVDNANQTYYANRAKYLVGLAQQDFRTGTQQNAGIYFSQVANDEMRLYNASMKVNRMQLLLSMLRIQIAAATGKVQTTVQQAATDAAQSVYKNMAKVLGDTVIGNMSRIPELIDASFHGQTFSSRLWDSHRPQFNSAIQQILARGLIMGESPDRFRRQIVKMSKLKTRSAFKAARTLLNTEFCRVQTSAELDSIRAAGFEEYEYIANPGCCPECQAIDGQIFSTNTAMPGTDLPPMHPNCRCSLAPHEDRARFDKWLDSSGQPDQEPETVEEAAVSETDLKSLTKDLTAYYKSLTGGKAYDKAKGEQQFNELDALLKGDLTHLSDTALKKAGDILDKLKLYKTGEYFEGQGIRFETAKTKKHQFCGEWGYQCAKWHEKFTADHPVWSGQIGTTLTQLPLLKSETTRAMTKNYIGLFRHYYASGGYRPYDLRIRGEDFSTWQKAVALAKNNNQLQPDGTRWNSGDDPRHTFVHEFGHFVGNSMNQKHKSDSWQQRFISKCVKEFGVRSGTGVKAYDQMAKYLSKYATANAHETFAEAFADYYTNGDKAQEFSKLFGEMLEKELST